MPRLRVIHAIFQRNFSSYFSGVLGYLFIIAFVVAGGTLAFNGRFFVVNEPNLDQLSNWYPLLLLFFIPAITMTVWADEKRGGTDELLFTLPATDVEVLLGKYFAVLAVYTVALLFSVSHAMVLMYLGELDWGLIGTTYVGYWLAGAALLATGMLASVLTGSTAVAFVLGVVLCGVPVFVGQVGSLLGLGNWLDSFGVQEQLRDFSLGIMPFSGLVYFISLTVFMLFINAILIGRRHWRSTERGNASLQWTIRTVCFGIILSCITAWAGFAAMRVDATSEQLFSLAPSTRTILSELKAERPIEIQAFLSPEVPREYAETRKRLEGLLRQFDQLGGSKLDVRYVDVQPYSKQADEAERFGIEPQQVVTARDGRRSDDNIFLGAVVISSYDKVTIPFFDKGLPIEYELTRSIQTVANKQRATVGVLQTDAQIIGGRDWQIVEELRKQYDVQSVSPAGPILADNFDVLLAVMPSSLTDNEMDHLVNYVKTGQPVLIFDDPFPLSLGSQFGITGAPRQSKSSSNPPGMMDRGRPEQRKADGGRASRLLATLGINWIFDQIVFDINNPHPQFSTLPAEFVFVTRENNPDAFSSDHVATRDLQEVIALYTGTITQRSLDKRGVKFEPLLLTSGDSGLLGWNEFVDEGGFNMFSQQPTANPRRDVIRRADATAHVLAAQLALSQDDEKLNAIFVADVDMISDVFFQERSSGNLNIEFDNVAFVLNAVDSLVGDESFISLRSRRAKNRTLTRVDNLKQAYQEAANEAVTVADDEAKAELERRREELGSRVKEIQENEAMDPIAKAQALQQAQQAEQQRFSLAEAKIQQRKNNKVLKIRNETKEQEKAIESAVRAFAVWLPAIPPALMGMLVFLQNMLAEKRNIDEKRRRD